MNNFIFKSRTGLLKKSSNTLEGDLIYVSRQIDFVLKEQRQQRQDLHDIKGMLNRLLVDKHLQMQVDEYFNDESAPTSADSNDLD